MPECGNAPSVMGGEREKKEMLKGFLNYGLVAAVVVWAAVVAMMAYRLDDSPWRGGGWAPARGGGCSGAGQFKKRNKESGKQGSKS